MRLPRLGALATLAVLGCGPSASSHSPAPAEPSSPSPPRAEPAAEAAEVSSAERRAAAAEVSEMLARVSETRGLPVRGRVETRLLPRAEAASVIRARVEKEMPEEKLRRMGEPLVALGLLPRGYDFVAGVYALVGGSVAGFYDPEADTMFLVDDLGEAERTETLAHELVHALQDQSYGLDAMTKHEPGKGDRISAAHALIEGDALRASWDLVHGEHFVVPDHALAALFGISMALTEAGSAAPRALQASLVAPYVDGTRFVQRLKRGGGWAAVDAAWKSLPETTEQLLHPDRWKAREPARPVPLLPLASLTSSGAPFVSAFEDVMGEQSLRIVLEDWTTGVAAEKAAAGWGGDRFVVARRPGPSPGEEELAYVWRLAMDTDEDAAELAAVLEPRFPKGCAEREDLGPLAWKRQGKDLALVAGPYVRRGTATRASSTCRAARASVDALLAAR